jgi:hypothetical protein
MIELIKYSRYFTANEKARCILYHLVLWFSLSRTKGPSPPSLFNLTTLITNQVSVFFLTLRLSCFFLGQPVLTTHVP